MATADWEEDEWELENDDGFVYKRKKRPQPTTSSGLQPPDPAAEEKNRRERKKRALVKLREKYQKEIDQWEYLSNTLRALQEKTHNQQWQELTTVTTTYDLAVGSPHPPESAGQRLLDDLLLRAEAEEAIIRDLSNLCEIAEAVCKVQEDHTKQSLVDLPVWASPRELLASLCDE